MNTRLFVCLLQHRVGVPEHYENFLLPAVAQMEGQHEMTFRRKGVREVLRVAATAEAAVLARLQPRQVIHPYVHFPTVTSPASTHATSRSPAAPSSGHAVKARLPRTPTLSSPYTLPLLLPGIWLNGIIQGEAQFLRPTDNTQVSRGTIPPPP